MFLKMLRGEVTTDTASSPAYDWRKGGRWEKNQEVSSKSMQRSFWTEGVVHASNASAEMTRRMNSLQLVMRRSWLTLRGQFLDRGMGQRVRIWDNECWKKKKSLSLAMLRKGFLERRDFCVFWRQEKGLPKGEVLFQNNLMVTLFSSPFSPGLLLVVIPPKSPPTPPLLPKLSKDRQFSQNNVFGIGHCR